MATDRKLDCSECPVIDDLYIHIKDDISKFFSDYVKNIIDSICFRCDMATKKEYEKFAKHPEKFYNSLFKQIEKIKKQRHG